MSWSTIYITGKSDFRDEVRRRLEHSDQRFLQGYIESPYDDETHDLYWLDGVKNLKAFKEAIGAKLIWKHRIRFYTSLEAFMASRESSSIESFSPHERNMIEKMQMSFSDPVL